MGIGIVSRVTLVLALTLTSITPTLAREYRWQDNGRCDDKRYNTSNGGRAAQGTDEYDCSRYGGGLKRKYLYDRDDRHYPRHHQRYRHYSYHDRYDRYNDDNWTFVFGQQHRGGFPDRGLNSNGIIWSDQNSYGGNNAWNTPASAQGLSNCQQTVQSGLQQRFQVYQVTFAGNPQQGRAFAAGHTFNYLCNGSQINVWE